MTLNEIVYDIKNILRNARPTDDDNITNEQIAFWVRTTRAKLIRNELTKGYSVGNNLTQTIECLPLTLVDASECCGLNLGCSLLRTPALPKPIQGTSEDAIFNIMGGSTIGLPISFIPYERVPYWGNNRFNKNSIVAFKNDDYIYILSEVHPGIVNITGIWENPEEISSYTNCDNESCFTWDSEYPMSAHMIDDMKKIIIDGNFRILLSTIADTKNNNLDDSVQRN